ncbi:MAG: Rieske (2Fe-2S) protein [Myxococcales bacterium]|nr:MAG: Rieske (2Fe-2S) protein [Myxococcales bacterium]
MRSRSAIGLPIPYGWYCVGYGDELECAGIQRLRYFGKDLVIFRGIDGVAGLVDAYCPHLGANLGYGRVDEAGLHCPFHGWTFDAAGYCVDIPYARRLPPSLRGRPSLGTYPLVEQNGFLWAWYHPHGTDPSFPLQEFEEISSGEWTDDEKRDWHIDTHVQESGENAVDSAHFLHVHKVGGILSKPDVTFDGHRRVSNLAMELTRITEEQGRERGKYVDGRILTMSSGPGQSWTRQFGVADLLIIGLATPVERERIHLRFACSVPKAQEGSHRVLSRMIIDNAIDQVEQDIPIWKNKIYQPRPVLCDGDGPIAPYREWFSQFYADES